MSQDPWEMTFTPPLDMTDNPLDLHDSMDDRTRAPMAFTQEAADWLSEAGHTLFVQGTSDGDSKAKEDAYAALAMPDQLSSPLGLDSAQPTVKLADVRAQPPNQDQGYDTDGIDGDLPNMTAIIHALMLQSELITRNQMIYLIVDNRKPEAIPHWLAFAAWWASRRCLVGPQEEATDVLWVCADNTTGLHRVPYYWAGVFVLEAARFLYPKQHFALIDNDCVPVTLFEVQDLLELAHQQLQWVDLVGHARTESDPCRGIGMLLFTEVHLEYNAGLVISIGSSHRNSPLDRKPNSAMLAKELQAYRLTLVSRARPPVTPSETAINGTMFTPFVGVPMQNALDLCVVWSLYGLYMCKNFWPCPKLNPARHEDGGSLKWPRQSHPQALTPAGQMRTPWLTSWARATFEQGILSVLPMLEGPCTATSLPGEHLFQASALSRDRMRPAIFHAFGKAKIGAQTALRDLEKQGWETLPMAILGTPNLPPAWMVDNWKPIGGCKFTGYCPGIVGNSALRFCLLLRWRAAYQPASELFSEQAQGDSLSCCPAEGNTDDLESADTPSSNNSENRAWHLAQAVAPAPTGSDNAVHLSKPTVSPQLLSPPLFASWNQVASLRGLIAVHKDIESCPHDELRTALDHPKCMFPGEKELFLAANGNLLEQLQEQIMPLEQIASEVFQAMYQRQQAEFSWNTLLWTVAQQNEYWIGYDALPLPPVLQINCGGLGGGALEGNIPPHFHCTCPPVGESQVYGPSLSPADVVQDEHVAVAAGCTTGIHEVATLFSHIQDPCRKWEDLGFGKAAVLYQRTQRVLKAARLLPAHRRLPHKAFLSGLWWKLLSLQPLQLIACLPMLSCFRQCEASTPRSFHSQWT